MTNVDVHGAIVDAVLDLVEDAQRVPRVPRRNGSSSLSRVQPSRKRRLVDSGTERVLRNRDGETLRRERALRARTESDRIEVGGANELVVAFPSPLLGRILVLTSLGVEEHARGTQGVDVVLVVVLERGASEVSSELAGARLDEEVGVKGSKLCRIGL